MSPALPSCALPVLSFIEPEETSATPVWSTTLPDSRVVVAVKMSMDPLTLPLPLVSESLPPVAVSLLPLFIKIEPPSAV